MDFLEGIGYIFGFLIGIGFFALFGILMYWSIKFVVSVPRHLKDIADLLEKIANKNGEQ